MGWALRCKAMFLVALTACCSRGGAQPAPSASARSAKPDPLANVRESPPAPQLYSVGQLAQQPSYSARVTRISECRGKDGYYPAPGAVHLGIQLEVHAPKDATLAFGHSHTKLLDARGQAHAAEHFGRTENCEPRWKYSRLPAGAHATAWLVFAIPEPAHALVLKVHPRSYLNEPATLFKLGR